MCVCVCLSLVLSESTHWGRDKMCMILQTTFSNAFYWMKIYDLRLIFLRSLFLRVQSTIWQHWYRWWLGTDQATSHYLNQWWLVYWHMYVSLSQNEFRVLNVAIWIQLDLKYWLLAVIINSLRPGDASVDWFIIGSGNGLKWTLVQGITCWLPVLHCHHLNTGDNRWAQRSVAPTFKMASIRVRCIREPVERVQSNVATRINVRCTGIYNRHLDILLPGENAYLMRRKRPN